MRGESHLRLPYLFPQGRLLMATPLGVKVPVSCQNKAHPPQFTGRTLCCSGGWRSIVGEPGTKGTGMLDPVSV